MAKLADDDPRARRRLRIFIITGLVLAIILSVAWLLWRDSLPDRDPATPMIEDVVDQAAT